MYLVLGSKWKQMQCLQSLAFTIDNRLECSHRLNSKIIINRRASLHIYHKFIVLIVLFEFFVASVQFYFSSIVHWIVWFRYQQLFDMQKIIPGAEPWSSFIHIVVMYLFRFIHFTWHLCACLSRSRSRSRATHFCNRPKIFLFFIKSTEGGRDQFDVFVKHLCPIYLFFLISRACMPHICIVDKLMKLDYKSKCECRQTQSQPLPMCTLYTVHCTVYTDVGRAHTMCLFDQPFVFIFHFSHILYRLWWWRCCQIELLQCLCGIGYAWESEHIERHIWNGKREACSNQMCSIRIAWKMKEERREEEVQIINAIDTQPKLNPLFAHRAVVWLHLCIL